MENCGDMFSEYKSIEDLFERYEKVLDFSKYLVEKYSCLNDHKYKFMASNQRLFDDVGLAKNTSAMIVSICSRMPDSDRETYLRQEYEKNIFGLVFFGSNKHCSLVYIKKQGLEMTMEDLYDEFKDYVLSEGWEIGPKRAEK